MSTIKTTYIQHPSAASPNLELAADGTVVLPLSDLEDLANVSGSPTDGQILSYDNGTSTWNPTDPSGGFDSSVTITATDATWSVPSSADGVFRVTLIGGGGGGGCTNAASGGTAGGTGGTTTFNAGAAGTATATGGSGGVRVLREVNESPSIPAAPLGFVSANGGAGGVWSVYDGNAYTGGDGYGGNITVAYFDLTSISTVNVTVGAGGSKGNGNRVDGVAGGRGEVIVEYRAA